MCAKLPPFLRPDADIDKLERDPGSCGPHISRQTLRNVFLHELMRDSRGEEWLDAHMNGKHFRDFYRTLCSGEELDAERSERWLRKLGTWAMTNPGVGYPCD